MNVHAFSSPFFFALLMINPATVLGAAVAPVIPGIEVLIQTESAFLKNKHIGLITNQTGVDRKLVHDIDVLRKLKDVQLVALFAPEHGIRGISQAGDKIENATDSLTGLPVFSLYGKNTQPTS